jgi:hypothetical protein
MQDVLPTWKQDDGTIRYDLPEELQQLTEAEKLLISPYLVYVPLHHMAKGQIGCKGHVCCFQQDIVSISNKLPRLPHEISLIRLIKKYKDENGEISSKIFNVRRDKVLKALYWLKKHSIAFEDVEIVIENLSWMSNNNEKTLPAATEKIIDTETAEHVTEDKGPSISQVHDVVTDDPNYIELFGTQNTDNSCNKMNDDNMKINKKLAHACKKR